MSAGNQTQTVFSRVVTIGDSVRFRCRLDVYTTVNGDITSMFCMLSIHGEFTAWT